MVQEITVGKFRDIFAGMGRGNSFTYEGLGLLFDHLERKEEDEGEPYKLDVIELCGKYNEETLEEFNKEHGEEAGDLDEAQSWLEERTSVIGITGDTILYEAL